MRWPSCHTTRLRTDLPTSSHVSELKVNCWSPDDCGDSDWYMYTPHVSDDFSRVKLQEIKGVEGSEYVNASYIDVCTIFIVMRSSDVNAL